MINRLEASNFEVITAYNGVEAIEKVATDKPDLILLDITMPVMNGLEVLEKLKDKEGFSVPILILSANKEEESKAAGIKFGASYYITKPFKPEEVVARIEDILA